MKKNLFKLSALIITILLIAGVASAQWQEPSGTPPYSVFPPVNNGSVPQVKVGGLSVGTFRADAPALFDQQVYIKDRMLGAGGGTLKTGPAVVYGNARSQGALGTSNIISTTPKRLCGDAQGKVVLCP